MISRAGCDHEPERAWDEYDWERFHQQQDHKTEKYMELLEKYLDDPNRDQIIAREMGWTQLLEGKDWTQEVDALLEEDGAEERAEPPDSFEEHSLYRAAFALTVWIDQMFDADATLQNEPSAVKLATHAALASAKLAAALSGEDVDEIGMTIAYLKRALKAITLSIDGAAALLRESRSAAPQHAVLLQRLFQVRERVATLLGEHRREWRRRFASEGFRG